MTQKSNILIVDDSKTNILFLKKHLENDYNIFSCFNGQEALNSIQENKPDIILLDIIMPIMDGYQTCKYIKQNLKLRHLPVIMITSLNKKKDRIQGIECGADDFLSKPIDPLELLTRVKSLIRIKKYNDYIVNQTRFYEKELKIAKILQKAILPPMNSQIIQNIELYAQYIPWMDIGGDYFNILELSKNHIGIFLADVMGHGLSASLVTMVLKTLLEMHVNHKTDPSILFNILNKELCKMFGNILIYATAIYLLIDTNKKQFFYSNAGHPPFLFFHEKKKDILSLKGYGKPLGIYENNIYKTGVCNFQDEDKIFMYTDGLTDAENNTKQMFGIENIEQFILKNKSLKPKKLINKLFEELNQFTGYKKENLQDDINVICLKL